MTPDQKMCCKYAARTQLIPVVSTKEKVEKKANKKHREIR